MISDAENCAQSEEKKSKVNRQETGQDGYSQDQNKFRIFPDKSHDALEQEENMDVEWWTIP